MLALERGEGLEIPLTLEQAVLASKGNISPLFFYFLKKENLLSSVDERIRRGLYRDYVAAQAEYLYHRNDPDLIISLFEREKITFLVFKGLYTRRFYPDPSLRLMGDYDFLIHYEDLEKVKKLLVENGFEIVKVLGREFLDRIGAEVTFRGSGDWKYIDVHYRLFQKFRYPFDEESVWSRSRGISDFFHYPTPEDQFVITIIHILKDGFSLPLVPWWDLYFIFKRGPDFDYIMYQVKESGISRGFTTVMKVMEETFGLSFPLKLTARELDVEIYREEPLRGVKRYSYALSTLSSMKNKFRFTLSYSLLAFLDFFAGGSD